MPRCLGIYGAVLTFPEFPITFTCQDPFYRGFGMMDAYTYFVMNSRLWKHRCKVHDLFFRLAAASNIIVITPFFFYSKGDQKDGYRVPITSKLVGTMLKKAGATHLMLLDPHTPQVEGFFDLIIDTLKVKLYFCY